MTSRYTQDSAGQVYIAPGATHGPMRVFRCHNGFVEEQHGKEWTRIRLVSNKHRFVRCQSPAQLLLTIERWHKSELATFKASADAYLHHSRGV